MGLKHGWTLLACGILKGYEWIWGDCKFQTCDWRELEHPMEIHQGFKARSTLAILHQNPKAKDPILTNHSPVYRLTPQRKSQIVHPAESGSFGKKIGYISQWSIIQGRVANHNESFPSVCGRGIQLVHLRACLRFSSKNHRKKIRTFELLEDPLKSLIWICWSKGHIETTTFPDTAGKWWIKAFELPRFENASQICQIGVQSGKKTLHRQKIQVGCTLW